MSAETKYNLKTQSDAVIHFLQNLDVEMVEAVLEDNRTYQDFEKPIFIHKLTEALNKFIVEGDTFLNVFPGMCGHGGCNYKCKGYAFVGNVSNNYLDMIIEIKDGVVHDMYECSMFKFKNKELKRNERIYINKFNFYDK